MSRDAFEYLKTKYAVLEEDYPYTAANGKCKYSKKVNTDVLVLDYTTVQPNSVD